MGVKGLWKFIKDKDKNREAINQQVKLKNYSGKRIAIDVNLVLKNFIHNTERKKGQPRKNNDGKVTSHLFGLFHSTIKLIENKIKPVYVFDGTPPDLKKEDLYEFFGEPPELKKYQLSKETISLQARDLLDLMGIKYVNAKEEAEAQCCDMVKKGIVDYVATNDMDALPFGAKIFLRNITSSKNLEEINSKKVLEVLRLDYNQLIDFCILLGCSYSETIPKIGSKRGYELIAKHKNIEVMLKYENVIVSQDWKNKIEEVRNLYKKPKISAISESELKWKKPNHDGLKTFLCEILAKESVENGIKKIEKFLSNDKQSTAFKNFFNPRSSSSNESKRKNDQEAGNGETSKVIVTILQNKENLTLIFLLIFSETASRQRSNLT